LQTHREQRRTYRASAGNATITAGSAAPSGAQVIKAAGVGKSYDGRPIVSDFSIRIQRGDRIGAQFRRLRPVVPAHRDQCDAGA
jgi:ATP-binding cassette subfamily F protein uup